MDGELDPRLIGLLRATLDFVDALRDVGVASDIAVRLDREGALHLLRVAQARGRDGISLAGLRFEWPSADPVEAFAENDNNSSLALDDESPALR